MIQEYVPKAKGPPIPVDRVAYALSQAMAEGRIRPERDCQFECCTTIHDASSTRVILRGRYTSRPDEAVEIEVDLSPEPDDS